MKVLLVRARRRALHETTGLRACKNIARGSAGGRFQPQVGEARRSRRSCPSQAVVRALAEPGRIYAWALLRSTGRIDAATTAATVVRRAAATRATVHRNLCERFDRRLVANLLGTAHSE